MRTRNEENSPLNIGSSTLMVIFLVLCMFTFAAISLSTARNDHANAVQNAERSTAWYAASSTAEDQLQQLNETARNTDSPEPGVTYEVTISDTQAIEVMLKWNTARNSYDILSWKTINTTEWTGTNTIHVLTPNS